MAEKEYNSYPLPPQYPPYEPPPPPFIPQEEQLERARKLGRFNFWTVYFPLGLLAIVVLGLLLFMLYLAIRPPYENTRPFFSGLADSVLILTLLPLVLICGLLQAAIVGGLIAWRQSRKTALSEDPNLQYGRLRLLLWRLEQFLDDVFAQMEPVLNRIAAQVIRLNEYLTYLVTRWRHIWKR